MSSEEVLWRVGEHYKIHVYEGDRPVATFHREADAKRAVDAYNRSVAASVLGSGEQR